MKNFMKKHSWLLFLSILAGVIYAFQFYLAIYKNPLSDIQVFTNFAKEYHNNYLLFAIERFFTWSQRLWIEAATMYFSTHYLSFFIMVVITTSLFLFSVSKFFKLKSSIVVLLLFLILFPVEIYLAAGSIPEFVNYLLPMFLFSMAVMSLLTGRFWMKILGSLLLVFAVAMEQFAVFGVLLFLYLLLDMLVKTRYFSFSRMGYLIISCFGLAMTKLSPGVALRYQTDMERWFPAFKDLNLFEKVFQGFIFTNYELFVSGRIPFVPIFLFLVLICALLKKKIKSAGLASLLLGLFVLNQLKVPNFLLNLPNFIEAMKTDPHQALSLEAMYIMLLFVFLLIALAILVVQVFSDWRLGMQALIFLSIGYACRMTIAFSPTLYASSYRTFTPFILSIFFVSLALFSETERLLYREDSPVVQSDDL